MKFRNLFTPDRIAVIGTVIFFVALWTDLPSGFESTMALGGVVFIAVAIGWSDDKPKLLNPEALRVRHVMVVLVAYSIISSYSSDRVMQRTERLLDVAMDFCADEGTHGDAIELARCIKRKLPEARDSIAESEADARASEY